MRNMHPALSSPTFCDEVQAAFRAVKGDDFTIIINEDAPGGTARDQAGEPLEYALISAGRGALKVRRLHDHAVIIFAWSAIGSLRIVTE